MVTDGLAVADNKIYGWIRQNLNLTEKVIKILIKVPMRTAKIVSLKPWVRTAWKHVRFCPGYFIMILTTAPLKAINGILPCFVLQSVGRWSAVAHQQDLLPQKQPHAQLVRDPHQPRWVER